MPMHAVADLYFVNDKGLNTKLKMTPPYEFDVEGATLGAGTDPVIPATKTFTTTLDPIEFTAEGFPAALRYIVEGKGNLAGETSNFIMDPAADLAEITMKLTVPLHFKASAYNRKDTIKFDYDEIIKNDPEGTYSKSIEEIVLKLKVMNGLPLNITMAVDAVDAAYQQVETIVEGADLTAGGESTVEVRLNQTQIERIRLGKVKHLILKTFAGTQNEDYVKVMHDDALDIHVSVEHFKSDIPL
jgi:hypothetical protein